MRSLRLANDLAEGPRIYFGAQPEYSVGMDSMGQFLIQKAQEPAPMLSVDAGGVLHINAKKTEVNSLEVTSDGLSIRGVRQWQMIAREDFGRDAGEGWSLQQVTECAGLFMLGGYCKFSQNEVNKTYTGLPPHKQLRIVATYHFIDRWIGETGYMKLNIGQANAPIIVWAEQHSQGPATNGVSLCGQSSTPEGKFAVHVDVAVPHTQPSFMLSFGSTMQNADPCDESWGVSNAEIYIRS